jgi:hypothetical protein
MVRSSGGGWLDGVELFGYALEVEDKLMIGRLSMRNNSPRAQTLPKCLSNESSMRACFARPPKVYRKDTVKQS